MPYDDSNVKKMIRYQTERKVGFSRSKRLSDEVKALIHGMLEADVSKRLTITHALSSTWMRCGPVVHPPGIGNPGSSSGSAGAAPPPTPAPPAAGPTSPRNTNQAGPDYPSGAGGAKNETGSASPQSTSARPQSTRQTSQKRENPHASNDPSAKRSPPVPAPRTSPRKRSPNKQSEATSAAAESGSGSS